MHFAVPTPVIVEDVSLRAVLAHVRFKTGSKAAIKSFRVYDGARRIATYDGVDLRSADLRTVSENIPEHPKVNWGVGFQLGVEFDGDGPDAWIAFVGAGVNFHG